MKFFKDVMIAIRIVNFAIKQQEYAYNAKIISFYKMVYVRSNLIKGTVN